MSSSKFIAFAAASVLAIGTLTATEARAYNPCERALQDVQEAEAAFQRWRRNNCVRNGECANDARGYMLLNRVFEARARASRACN